MKYIRETLVFASFLQAVLINALLFKCNFWQDYNTIQAILLWVVVTYGIAFALYKFQYAMAKGGTK